jgi:hypothetical protein
VASEQNDKRNAVEMLQTKLAETEASVEHERSVSVDLSAKLASAEEMLTNVIGINEYLVRQGSEHAHEDAKAASSDSSSKGKTSKSSSGRPRYMMGTDMSRARQSGKAPSRKAPMGSLRSRSHKASKVKASSKTTKVQLEKANDNKVS